MAFYDWNRDGKKDFLDDWIEYSIYKQTTKNHQNNSGSGFGSGSGGADGCGMEAFYEARTKERPG